MLNQFYLRFIGLIVLVLVISGLVIYLTVDINTITYLNRFQPWSVLLAVGVLGVGMFFDGSRLLRLVRISNEKISFHQAVQVVFGNYFLALLTPGATGGAVAQLMFLRRAGVPTGKAAVLVIVRALLSIFFLMVCIPFILIQNRTILPGVTNDLLFTIMMTIFLIIIIAVIMAKQGSLDDKVAWLARKLNPKRRKILIAFYRDVKGAINLLGKAPGSMFVVFLESGINLLCIYAIVPCLLLGLGIYEADWYTVMGRMIFLNMILYFTPSPGGAGVAEGGFIYLFADTVPTGMVGILAVCWRLLAEYLPFLIGLYYTVMVFGKEFLTKNLANID